MLLTDAIKITIKLIDTSVSKFTNVLIVIYVLQIDPEAK
jgi:hypothetical protein